MNRTWEISRNKIKVEIVETSWGKKEAKVTLINGYKSFIPSFTDLFRIVEKICDREEIRYPNGKGRRMVGEFLKDACEMEYSQLIYKYNIPLTNDSGDRIFPWDLFGREECLRRSYSNSKQLNLFYLDADFEEALKGIKE